MIGLQYTFPTKNHGCQSLFAHLFLRAAPHCQRRDHYAGKMTIIIPIHT